MNWGVSDIAQGARLAWKIYQYGFNDENKAHVQYKNFYNDILGFHGLLERLDTSLTNAQQRYSQRGLQIGVRTYDPLTTQGFDEERKTIIGNFQATLKECEALIEQNKKFRVRQSSVPDNLLWHMKEQSAQLDNLRSRLQFHSHKIRLVIDRLSIDLLTDRDATLQDILANTESNLVATRDVNLEVARFRTTLFGYLNGTGTLDTPNPENQHSIGDEVSQKLEEFLQVDAPSSIASGIPIAPGFDALYSAFLEFEKSVDGSDQTPETYLLFLKTRWLVSRIQASNDFKKAPPGFYFKRAINQIAQVTMAKMRQPGELIKYPEEILLELSDIYFRIWPSPVQTQTLSINRPHPLMVRANEVKVVRVELASNGRSEKDSVTIFKSSEERFRIVLEQSLPSSSHAREVIPQIVLTSEDKLIPRFALPTLTDPTPEIAIFSRGEETFYQFDSMDDLNSFEAALTGYEVSHNQDDIICQFSRDLSKLDCDNTRIQLWQDPIGSTSAVESNGSVRNNSVDTTQASPTASHSRHDSLMPSITRATTISETAAAAEADRVKLSALVMFTQLQNEEKTDNRFAIIFIELGRRMRIDPYGCNCSVDYDKCSKLVLSRDDKAEFKVRILLSTVDSQGQPDPNSFDLLQFRLPRHPNYDKLLVKKTKYLLLKFKNLEAKKLFHREINDRFRVQNAQIREQRDFGDRMAYLQDQPRQLRGSFSQQSGAP